MSDIPQPLRRKPVITAADSRYVSLFSDANNKSDITFTDGHKGLLPKSTKLYEVGVDNLTLSLNGLSMLPPPNAKYGNVILEILALRTDVGTAVYANENTWEDFPADFRIVPDNRFQWRDDDTYLTYHQVELRLKEIGDRITQFINQGFVTGVNWELRDVIAFTPPLPKHLEFELLNTGRLRVKGSRTFWSYFCLHIPNPHYRDILYGPDHRFGNENDAIVSLDPRSGTFIDGRLEYPAAGGYGQAWVENWAVWNNAIDGDFAAAVSNNAQAMGEVVDEAFAAELLTSEFKCNLFSGLDHRVCIEVGTSLPLTHSALIEDNKEKPDYSIGRFMMNLNVRAKTEGIFQDHEIHGPSTYELMNSNKRVLYHRLLPQEKVSVLRIQMYARRRTYDEKTNKWTMRVDPLPTMHTDWWHCRLHFRELHVTAISQKQSPNQ